METRIWQDSGPGRSAEALAPESRINRASRGQERADPQKEAGLLRARRVASDRAPS